ncbi:MAG: carboxylating nicotinate-nucleotide diphosphorylase [bacterium]|nr:carboxylating nicotinate-nucleotide diphosphorylase [bacterium]
MFYYTYILQSLKNNSLYIGYTSYLKKRFEKHNSGLNLATKPFIPYKLIFYEAFLNRIDDICSNGIILKMKKNNIFKKIIRQAIKEDVGTGDVTSLAIIPNSQILYGKFLSKNGGIVSGLDIVKEVFSLLNKNINFNAYVKDGAIIHKGQILATVKGHGRSILSAERTALNFLQRMSGIATATRRFVDAVAETKAIILDTRKTAPGLRIFDKQAVKDGDGQNHRFGLYDMYLIKDNHIAAAGSITKAIQAVRKNNKRKLRIEIEVKNLDELNEAVSLKPDWIMLDNMDIENIRRSVKIVNKRIPIEVSGGVNLETVSEIAKTGVNYISVGALTHSVKALDISLEIKNK